MTYSEHVMTSIELPYASDYSLQLARWFLTPIGAWPRMYTATRVERFSSHVHVLACWSVIAMITVSCVLYVSLEEKDIDIKLSVMGPLSHWIVSTINYCLLVTRGDDIRECVLHMETDWRHVRKIEDRQVMMRQARIGRFVAGFCAMFMQSGTFLFVIAKSLSTVTVIVGNETLSVHPMSCPFYKKLIDTRFSPANEIMMIVEWLSCFIVNSVTVGACSLDAIFAMHACGQLNMLFLSLNKLVDEDKRDECVGQKLAIVVQHHLRVLSFISRIEAVMRYICLVELLGCTMNMCLLAYYFITTMDSFDAAKSTSYVMIYLSKAFNIFIYCYFGDMLTEQCKNVGEKAYMINWYELPHKTTLGLILMIVRSSNVIKMTAGKLFHLSIATFGDAIKTSMVYLNMLRTMRTVA
ncbi:odorant receptor 2a isoform X2 [Monomorium pharaonis]|uniref:odorant receptor 2a isoform X2 n=1 Tax=Monomorium pharaonis TaxID=307658 RepID=UPI0017475A13|nr:odorant receptor 2a isoform X2 [Monomorium pharaonis]